MNFPYGTWYIEDETKEMKDAQVKIFYKGVNYFGNYDIAEKKLKT